MKKYNIAVISFFIVLVIVAICVIKLKTKANNEEQSVVTYELGDINKNGVIDTEDVQRVLKIYSEYSSGYRPTEDELKYGDVDKNGSVDGSDATLILRCIAQRAYDDNLTMEKLVEQTLGQE